MGALGELLKKIFQSSLKARDSLLLSSNGVSVLAIAAFTTVVFAAYAAINTLILGLAVAMPSELVIAASWVVPSNSDECITAVIAAHMIKATLDYKAKLIEMQSNASLIT